MKGQNKVKKQSAKTTSTIRATIEFSNIYDVCALQNGLYSILKGNNLEDVERKELQRFIDLIESMTGNDFLSYWLENHK